MFGSRSNWPQRFAVIVLLWLVAFTRLSLSNNPIALDNIDAAGFHRLALNVLDGNGFSMAVQAPYCPESVRTPAYPLFLAGLYAVGGPNLRLAFWIQGLLDMIAAAVVFRLSSALYRKRPFLAGILALAVYVITLSQWRFANELLSEALLTPLLALSVFLFWQAANNRQFIRAAGVGVFLGIAVLTKPNVELAPIVFLVACLLIPHRSWGFRLLCALALGVGLGFVLVPWFARNQAAFGSLFLSRTYDDNIARVSAVATLAETNHQNVEPWSADWETLYGTLVNRAAAEYQWDSAQPQSCAVIEQRRSDVAAVAVKTVREHPVAFVASYVKGSVRGLIPQEQFYWYERLTGEQLASGGGWASKPPLALVLWAIWLVGYGLMYLGLIASVVVLRKQPHLLIVLAALLVIGLFLPGPLAYVRFRVPIAPLMAIMATVGALWLVEKGRAWKKPADQR